MIVVRKYSGRKSLNKYFILLIYLNICQVGSVEAKNWTNQEVVNIKRFAFDSIPQQSSDPSNRFLYHPDAIKLGKLLFNEKRFSENHNISCASCHIRNKNFTDGKNVALGMKMGQRNTPTLLGVAEHHWFFWDGSKDSLWAQALSSIENPAEQGFTRMEMLHFMSNDEFYRNQYWSVFNESLPDSRKLQTLPSKASPNGDLQQLMAWKKLPKKDKQFVNRFFSNIGKSIAAYVSTLKHKPARFDRFVTEIGSRGDSQILNESEQNGLKLFMSSKAGCANCHLGGLFTNKEFHNIGTGIPMVDNGRSEVIDAVIRDEFNCLGKYSDARPEQCTELKYANRNKHVLSGSYKTPGLRNISQTAPYMHDGRFPDLKSVLRYYAGFTDAQARTTDLPVIQLSEQEQQDIVEFLKTL